MCGLGGDCEKVQTSEWANLAGVPVALLGLIGYAAILVTLFIDREEALIAGRAALARGLRLQRLPDLPRALQHRRDLPVVRSSAVIMTLLAIVTTARLLLALATDRRGAVPYVG